MSRFFRRLRLRFLMEGKAQRYFYYACGEILLIVIGILIALQLNNWNESRKNNLRLESTLNKLADDLSLNKTRFDQLAGRQAHFLAATQLLFDAHLNGVETNGHDKDLANAFRYATFFPPIIYSDDAYSELLNNNGFKRLASPKLKEMIVEYYDHVDWLRSKEVWSTHLTNDIIEDIYHFTVIAPGDDTGIMQRKAIEEGGDGTGEDSFTISYDLEAFRANVAMNGRLYDLIDFHKDRIGKLEYLNQLGLEIIAEIKSEIDDN